MPKLNSTTNYYSRSLWFFIFNIYIHNTKQSFVYHFIEGTYKKGANSVASFIFGTLKQIDLTHFNEIIMFSDNYPGQNKNGTVFKSLLYFANYFKIQISHIYPVKGHSYCVCDRQFGLFTKKKKIKNYGVIEHPQKYIEIMKFEVSDIEIKNYERFFNEKFSSKLNVKISTLKKIVYHSNG